MFHMLSSFNLKDDVSIEDFQVSLNELSSHLIKLDLLFSVSLLGQRVHHQVMDTDSERLQNYFFIMTFKDEAQCDQSVSYVYSEEPQGAEMHSSVWDKVRDPVFSCWNDV